MEILLAFALFVLFFLCMALGVMLKNKPLKGSCGGVAALMGNDNCEFCGGDPNKCDAVNDGPADGTELAYDATDKQSR